MQKIQNTCTRSINIILLSVWDWQKPTKNAHLNFWLFRDLRGTVSGLYFPWLVSAERYILLMYRILHYRNVSDSPRTPSLYILTPELLGLKCNEITDCIPSLWFIAVTDSSDDCGVGSKLHANTTLTPESMVTVGLEHLKLRKKKVTRVSPILNLILAVSADWILLMHRKHLCPGRSCKRGKLISQSAYPYAYVVWADETAYSCSSTLFAIVQAFFPLPNGSILLQVWRELLVHSLCLGHQMSMSSIYKTAWNICPLTAVIRNQLIVLYL